MVIKIYKKKLHEQSWQFFTPMREVKSCVEDILDTSCCLTTPLALNDNRGRSN